MINGAIPLFLLSDEFVSGCSCRLILSKSRGAVNAREPRPDAAPPTISCQCGYECGTGVSGVDVAEEDDAEGCIVAFSFSGSSNAA